MNFEEKFPSLKGKKLLSHNNALGLYYGKPIQENCLDKTIVARDYVPRVCYDAANIENAKLKAQSLNREVVKKAIDRYWKRIRKNPYASSDMQLLSSGEDTPLNKLRKELNLKVEDKQ